MNQKGFSVLEILISILILSLLAAIATQAFSNFRTNVAIQTEVEDIISLLERARVETVSSFEDSQYGVHVESDRVVFFQGDTYSAIDPDNEEFPLIDLVSITEISLNGGSVDIVYERLTGSTDDYGTLTVTASSNASTTRTINVYQNGTIDIE